MDNSIKYKIIIASVALIVIAGFLFFTLNRQVDHQITISENTVAIKAPFGQELNTSDIQSIQLLDKMPQVEKKINGSDTNVSLNGAFSLKDYGNGYCYIAKKDQGPFILIQLPNGVVVINETAPEKTKALYDNLMGLK